MEEDRQQAPEPGAPDAGRYSTRLQPEVPPGAPDAQRYLDNWRRAEADFENYKKRIEQERSETARFAGTALILNMLPVLDDLDRALKSMPDKLTHLTWTDGIRLIHRKLQATLEAQGVTEIKATGETFDPSVHDAVGQTAGEDGKIIEEAQRGYKLHGRVIRPAFVIVGNGSEPHKNEAEPPKRSDDAGG
jgi:molecular chaperone GrpE